jgi:hypothetical protein
LACQIIVFSVSNCVAGRQDKKGASSEAVILSDRRRSRRESKDLQLFFAHAEKAHGSKESALLLRVLERNWNPHLSVRRAPTGRDIHFGKQTQGCAHRAPMGRKSESRT